MKKAFTLIELIATIVILGIVASVVSVLVMNIIRSSKENANRRNIDEYGRIIETSMAEYQSQYLKYPDSIDQLEIEYVGSVIECETRRINPDKTIYLSECKVNGKKVLDKSTEDGYYHYGKLVLTNEEYVDKLGKNIEVALKDYYEENNKYPINYRLLNLPKLDKDINCVSEIHQDGTVYLTKCSIDGSYILNENEEDGYYHYGEKNIYDYVDKDGNGYNEVEYLESTGTQWIDTEYIPNNNTGFYMQFTLLDKINQNGKRLLGSSKRNNGVWGGISLSSWNQYDGGQMTYGKSGVFYNPKLVSGEKIWIKVLENKYTSSTGADLLLTYDSNFLNNLYGSLYIMNIHTDVGTDIFSSLKLYSFKIYDSNTLVRDYIPVISSTEKPCLFDIIEKKCYYNKGTGEFLYG